MDVKLPDKWDGIDLMNEPKDEDVAADEIPDTQQNLEAESSPIDFQAEPAGTVPQGGHPFPKIIKFESLTRCGEEVWIENNGQVYRLRRTRQGKLILTK